MKTGNKGSALVIVMIISVLLVMVMMTVSSISSTIYKKKIRAVVETQDIYLARSLVETISGMACQVDAAGVKPSDTQQLLNQLRGFGTSKARTRWQNYNSPFADADDVIIKSEVTFDYTSVENLVWPDFSINALYDCENETITLVLSEKVTGLGGGNEMQDLLRMQINEYFALFDDGNYRKVLDTGGAVYGVAATDITDLYDQLSGVTDIDEIDDLADVLNNLFSGDFLADIQTQYVDETFNPVGINPCIIYVEAGTTATVQPHDVGVDLSQTDVSVDSINRYFFIGENATLVFKETDEGSFNFGGMANTLFILDKNASLSYEKVDDTGGSTVKTLELSEMSQWWLTVSTSGAATPENQPDFYNLLQGARALTLTEELLEDIAQCREDYEALSTDPNVIPADYTAFADQVELALAGGVTPLEDEGAVSGAFTEIKEFLADYYMVNPAEKTFNMSNVQLAFTWLTSPPTADNWPAVFSGAGGDSYYDVKLGDGKTYQTPNFVSQADLLGSIKATCIEVLAGSRLVLKNTGDTAEVNPITLKMDRSLVIFVYDEASFACAFDTGVVLPSNCRIYVVNVTTKEIGMLDDLDCSVDFDRTIAPGDLYDALYESLQDALPVIDGGDGTRLASLGKMMHYTAGNYEVP